ncbi:hypothetical protein BDZ90DRAFT_230774 [Jaminaea rosea]|uniref:Uncharacterized protein n=1 Tax=Jaminaea rosea TaxID=1569628 RepID=A0A316UUU3_9BASI|nr:hypothetical protein BDZ90DRAFT_230774 [Jaminaea rosea]PWN28764.1 hypothetical protein BDZ90DRAFT_230774 [Jaminaea rosea]
MSNNLSPAQSASWTDYSASTCCTNSTATTCFFRLNSDVSGQERCTIPNCATLEDGDTAQMAGFKPLSTSSGSGPNNNTFKISSSAATKAHQHGQGKLVGAAAALVAAGATAFMVL